MPPHTIHTHTHGEAFHAVTQGLLSFQCFSVIVLSYINPLSCSIDIPCQHSLSLSMQQEDQAGILAFWWSLSHCTHTYSLTKLCMSVQQGLEGKEGDKGLQDSISPVEAVRSAHISSKLCFGLFFVAVCFGEGFLKGEGRLFFFDLLCVLCVFSRASQVVVQTNTAYRPSQSRAELHKVCLICVVTLWCRMPLLCLVRCVRSVSRCATAAALKAISPRIGLFLLLIIKFVKE